MLKFSKIALAAALTIASAASMAAGGLSVSITNGNSVTTVQGGTTVGARNLSDYKTTVSPNPTNATTEVKASYGSVSFSAETWTVTGGTFTAGTPYVAAGVGGFYTSASDVGLFVNAVKADISTAVQQEVTYIGTLVNDASTKIANYNGSATGTSSQSTVVDDAISTLKSEVDGTRAEVNKIKTMKFSAGSSVAKVIDGTTYQDFVGASVVTTTGGTNTIGANGAVTFN